MTILSDLNVNALLSHTDSLAENWLWQRDVIRFYVGQNKFGLIVVLFLSVGCKHPDIFKQLFQFNKVMFAFLLQLQYLNGKNSRHTS